MSLLEIWRLPKSDDIRYNLAKLQQGTRIDATSNGTTLIDFLHHRCLNRTQIGAFDGLILLGRLRANAQTWHTPRDSVGYMSARQTTPPIIPKYIFYYEAWLRWSETINEKYLETQGYKARSVRCWAPSYQLSVPEKPSYLQMQSDYRYHIPTLPRMEP